MLRLIGRSKTKKFEKETKDAKPKELVKRKPVKERSPARPPPVEAPSELQVARADAFKKTHAVQEKGLPSFAEFGTKDMLLYEDDSDEDEPGNDREPTLKAGLMVPGQDDRRGRGRHSAGSGSAYSRSPSPQLMPPSRDPSPMGRVPSPHVSPLRERSYAYDQYQHSPQHGTGQNLGSYYSDRPAADPAWRSSSYDPYGPQTTPNSYHQPTSAYPQDYYTSANPGGYDYRTPNSGDPYGLAPQMPPYTAPPQLHDPYRQPVHPPTHWNDVQPQYPSPSTDRYYASPGHSHQRAQSYDQPAYYGQAGSPARYPPSQAPSVPHQAGAWGAEVYEDPRARQYSQTNAWQNPASGYTPPHHQSFPTRQAPSPQPYAHHHRSHTVDAGIPYYSATPAPPAPSNPLPTRASEHQLRSQQWDHQALDQQIRRRTYSLQQPDSRVYQEEYDVRAQRTGRHSDCTQQDPRTQPATQPAYGSQQYPQPTSQQVSRSNTRRRVESMTTQLERTHISSPARPASRQEPASRLSIYHTPSDSRSRDSFDFSSSSEVDVSPSPSPAPRRHRQRTSSLVDGRPQSVYPPSDPRTSLQALPEEGYTYNEPEGRHGAGGYHQNYERERTKQLPDPVRSTPREISTFEEPSPGPTLQDIRRKATRRYTEAPREIEDRHRSRARHSEVSGTNQYQQDYSDRGRELPQPTEPYSREPSTAGYEPENISHYSQVQTNVDHQYSASAAPQQYIHESDRSSPSKPSRESQMYESQTRSHTLYDEPEESVPAPPPPSRTPAPTTPHRRRTVVLNGPRGPRSPPTQNILSSSSPAARVSLARA
ncbi:hypothetical protein FRC04_002315 [Tulasnella sp. 424]|nr:hypothetical protein FRC04_002315 [Tulasnella sp. 424]KAG8977388.1 hypothetical protein FRC05_001786 [Tulasnella sp. 425]